jgi:ubiquinone/menaquinone biosynthesis C-methylase UbiE
MKDPKEKIQLLHQNLRRLRKENDRLRWALQEAIADPEILWLFENRQERMDANRDLFAPERAAFHKDRYVYASQFVEGRVVLDAACGTGYGADILAKAGAHKIFGVDIDYRSIRYAENRFGQENIEFIQGDVTNVPCLNNSCDVVISFETIEHVADDQSVVAEFARVLKTNGILIISTPNEWPLEIAPFHKKVYNYDSFSDLISSHFKISQFMNQNSGSDFKYNHNQPSGITYTNLDNAHLAECFIVVAVKL